MLRRTLPFALLLPLATAQVSLPGPGQPRYVDFSQELATPGAVVVAGTLGKWKEGKRERLPDGQLGGGGAVAAELLKPQHDSLLVQHVAPLEKRAQQRLDDSGKDGAAKDGAAKDGAEVTHFASRRADRSR